MDLTKVHQALHPSPAYLDHDILDARRRINLQLALPLAEQILYGGKVLPVQQRVFLKLIPVRRKHKSNAQIKFDATHLA